MAVSGKYNFKGMKKHGASSIMLALASNPSTVWMTKVPLMGTLFEFGVNWLANNGLILMNIGAIVVNGEVDQSVFDRAMEDGIRKSENPGNQLTPEQMKEIDDAVIKAADKFLPYARSK